MRRRGILLLGGVLLPATARAMTPCEPGTRAGVLAELRFGLLLPNGDDVTDAQWRTFRSDILDPVLRSRITERDEPPVTRPRPQRIRAVFAEVRASWSPDAPPALPPEVQSVIRAWTARFPEAPVEARLLPVCIAVR
ncbi:hypothetical protein J5Y09_12840 [Roseomonas sp. PWR1]|uniref:Uncharacterized protein n=1 Tax=Roseomonas nitratireducens TaxID=2820810 RepID=A0ABS4ATV8_9PROT|nr:hypothetical protein [Neoroseomonas nitratireducens]MBP0464800.1 hypothetical protein [Neoroseomonas nitratireducens]